MSPVETQPATGSKISPGPHVGVPVQLPGGMQRELPLLKTQQTQPSAQAPGLAAQTTLPHCAWVTCASASSRRPATAANPAAMPPAIPLRTRRRDAPDAKDLVIRSNRSPSISTDLLYPKSTQFLSAPPLPVADRPVCTRRT